MEIEKTLRTFYSLANQQKESVCDLFVPEVFLPPEGEAGSVPPSREIICRNWLKTAWDSSVKPDTIEKIQEESSRALALYSLQGKGREGSLGGAILVQNNNVWQIATLSGLRGRPGSEQSISEALVAEYNRLGEGAAYQLPEEPPEELPEEAPEEVPEVLPEDPPTPKTEETFREPPPKEPAVNLSCPGGKRFDFAADVRRENNFRLWKNQKEVAGGDILSASHSLAARRGCLFVRFAGDYRRTQSLILELYYNSWSGSSPTALLFDASTQRFFLRNKRGRTPLEGQVSSSANGKKLRLSFPPPPGWKNSRLPFWFLRSSFRGGNTLLFDEGRPAGQRPPANASNLEGGWPR